MSGPFYLTKAAVTKGRQSFAFLDVPKLPGKGIIAFRHEMLEKEKPWNGWFTVQTPLVA